MDHLIMAIQVILESLSSEKDELQALTAQLLIRTSQIREVELPLELDSHDQSLHIKERQAITREADHSQQKD